MSASLLKPSGCMGAIDANVVQHPTDDLPEQSHQERALTDSHRSFVAMMVLLGSKEACPAHGYLLTSGKRRPPGLKQGSHG